MIKESLISKEDYTFYEDGRIWSKAKENLLKGYLNKNGYIQVKLKCTDGKRRHFQWHRVIWIAFNGEIPNELQVNHINEDKTDNRLCNLELVTPKQNCNHATRNERIAATQKNSIKRSKPVVAVDKEGNIILEFASTREAGRQGFNQGCVAKCCRNMPHHNTYKGLRWRYA